MLKYSFVLVAILLKEVLPFRDNRISAKLAGLETSICDGIKHPLIGVQNIF